jgi:hypothetical protein
MTAPTHDRYHRPDQRKGSNEGSDHQAGVHDVRKSVRKRGQRLVRGGDVRRVGVHDEAGLFAEEANLRRCLGCRVVEGIDVTIGHDCAGAKERREVAAEPSRCSR